MLNYQRVVSIYPEASAPVKRFPIFVYISPGDPLHRSKKKPGWAGLGVSPDLGPSCPKRWVV